MLLLSLLVACKGPADDSDAPPTDTDGVDTDDTAAPIPTADTAPPPPPTPVVDCSTVPVGPFDQTALVAPRGYHGLAFDAFGALVGNDQTSMIRATTSTDASLWIPNVGTAQQMDYLPDGDLAVAADNNGRIVRVAPDGSSTVLASNVYAYGLEVGPDGRIWVANQNVVRRIDPVTGDSEVVVSSINSPKVVNFNREGTVLYVGTNDGSGRVWSLDLDANHDPVGAPTPYGTTGGSWHDGLGVDACGNLYVNEYYTRSLYLITPDGTTSQLIAFDSISSGAYGHGIQWGGGVGSWSDHNIYVPLPYGGNRIGEIELGRPSKDYNGGVYDVVP